MIDFGKKFPFQIFFICFEIDFQTFIVHKKRLRSTFLRYTSRNHYLFRLSIGVIEKAIILNILYFQIHRQSIGVIENAIILNSIFIFKSIDMTVLRV